MKCDIPPVHVSHLLLEYWEEKGMLQRITNYSKCNLKLFFDVIIYHRTSQKPTQDQRMEIKQDNTKSNSYMFSQLLTMRRNKHQKKKNQNSHILM